MNGMIRTADAMNLVSANGRHGETVLDLGIKTMSDPKFSEIAESVRRYGIQVPVLILNEELCNGTHRVTAAICLGIEEIPYTTDPEIGWGNEDTWPEEKEACSE